MGLVNSFDSWRSHLPVVALSAVLKTGTELVIEKNFQTSIKQIEEYYYRKSFLLPINFRPSFALLHISLSSYAANQLCRWVGLPTVLASFPLINLLSATAYGTHTICDFLFQKICERRLTRLRIRPGIIFMGKHTLEVTKLGVSCYAASRMGRVFGVKIPLSSVCGTTLVLKINLEFVRFINKKK